MYALPLLDSPTVAGAAPEWRFLYFDEATVKVARVESLKTRTGFPFNPSGEPPVGHL